MLLWLLISLALCRVSMVATGRNYSTPYNGFGAIDGVLKRNSDAPMVYRVLIPWLIGGFEKVFGYSLRRRLILYEAIKFILLAGSLVLVERVCGRSGALLVAALIPITFCFDYWCWIPELGAFAAALSGNFELALICAVILAFCRETCPVCSMIFMLKTHNLQQSIWIFVATIVVFVVVRKIQGKHPLYCPRFMIRRNWSELKQVFKPTPWFLCDGAATLVLCGAFIAACFRQPAGWQAGVVVLVLGWTCGVARETRIFCPLILWIGMAFA